MLITQATAISATAAPDMQHLGATVLIAVFAVLFSGLVSLAREMREETAHRP